MDRNREARRVTMAASNGLSRRRHRSNSLRDSPEDDGPLELQETARLRDRGPVKKDRDRDRERDHRDRDREKDRDRDRMSSRSKRRRGDRMMHGSNREDGGDDSSEESVNEEEDEDDDDGSGVGGGPGGSSMRMLPPNPTSFSSSSMSNHHHRKSFPPPVKVFRTGPTMTAATPPTATTPSPNATPWKAPDEMIGVSVPRKARSASTKRSHECWASSGGGVVGGEQIHRQASTSPARSSGPSVAPIFASASPSPAPVSPPSSSNASVKKKMKPNGPKQRPPKSTKSVSSAQDEIEIEIAQVLFGLGRQPQGTAKQEVMGNDSMKFDSRDVNNNINKPSFDAKSRVSSPISNSPSTITLAPSIPPTTNSSSSATPMSAIAPRRKRPRPVKYEEENPSAYPVRSSPMSLNSKAEIDQPAKIDASSPNLEKNSVENGGISYDLSANQVAQVSAEPQPEAVKPENNNLSESKPVAEESAGRDLIVNREEPRSPKKEPPSGLRLDGDRGSLAGTKGNSAISESENHREEKFQIDLMAPPPSRSSPERDSEIDFVAIDPKKPKLQDVEMELKPMVKDDEKKAVKFGKDDMKAEHVEKKTKLIAEESEFQKPNVNRERNIDLHFDLEKSDRDNANAAGTGNRLQLHGQMVQQQQQTNAEKTVQTSSLPLPMSLASWPGAHPHMGYMAPLQGVVSMEGNTVSSTPIQPPHLLFNQPRPKRCATHCYIARIIQCHQQIARMNPFWPAATGSALAYGPKPCNVNVVPSSELHAGRGVNSVQDKGQGIAIFPGPAGKDKSSQPSNIVDNTQRKQIVLQQALPPGAPGNILHGPAFIFPLSQQQAAVAAAVRPGTVKSPPVAGSGGSSSSASVSATATAVAGATALSFNYPNLPGNETQYLAILQNGPYPIPIPAHVGATPPYRGAHTQALPFFNGSFYSSQMLHPSQLQQQQSAAPQSQQSQQGHQNSSISSGSSSSQKHLQNQQQRPHGSGINGGSGNLQGFPAPKHQQSHSLQLQQRQQTQSQNVPHQARQLESELGGEDSPSTADSRVSRSSMSIYGQNFAIPMNQPNFALMTPASMGAPASNPGEKKQHSHTHGSKPGVEALTSQPFAMSFPSINGTSAPSFDISSIAQNHAFIQNLPEATRHSYHFMAAAATAQAAQQKKNYRVSDEGKTGGTDGSNLEEERKAMAGGKAPPNAAQLIAFSRPDLTDASASPMPGNTVIDSSARTLNLSSTPARASSSIMSAAISNANTPPVQQQLQRNHQQQLLQHQHQQLQQHQHQQMQQQQQQMQQQQQQMQQQHQQLQQQQQQQVIQLPKQHQFAAAVAAASARSKAPATSNGSVYSDHLSSSPSMATKFPNTLPAFPQTLVQSSSSPVQSPQWKNSMRTTTSQIPSPSLSSASPSLKNLPQHQGRTQQGHAQISFSANPKPTAVQQGQGPPSNNQSSSPPMVVGSPTTSSVSKGAGGSPRTSSSAGNKGGQSSSLSSQQAKNSPSMPAQKSSPAGGRNVPSILGHPHNAPSPSSSGTKPQLTQQLPKHALQPAQMLYTSAYMQAQAQHAASATNSLSAGSGFYLQNLQRHRGEHQQQPPGPSANSSSGMLSLCTPVTLANTSTTDPAKAAAADSNMKGSSLASQALVHAQFAAAQSAGKQQHQLLPAGFSYVHAVPSTVQVKPSEQKQPAGE